MGANTAHRGQGQVCPNQGRVEKEGWGGTPEVPGERHRILYKELTSDPTPLLQRTPPGHSSNWRAVQPALRGGCGRSHPFAHIPFRGRPCSQPSEYVPSGAHASRLTHTDVYLPAFLRPAETTHPLQVFPSPPGLWPHCQQPAHSRDPLRGRNPSPCLKGWVQGWFSPGTADRWACPLASALYP